MKRSPGDPLDGPQPKPHVPPQGGLTDEGRRKGYEAVGRGGNGKFQKKQAAEPEEALSEDTEELVVAMRHVASKPASKDRTYQQRDLRAWKGENISAFMAKLTSLEEEAKKAAPPPPAAEQDPGSERVQELIEKLLKGYP